MKAIIASSPERRTARVTSIRAAARSWRTARRAALRVIGAEYSVETGLVDFFDDEPPSLTPQREP